jgi:hypothetical protein
MGVNYNSSVVSSNLVLNLDAGNARNLSNVNRNLLTSSEAFDNAVWGKDNCTVMPNNILAPDGTLTADTMMSTITGGNNTAFLNQTPTGFPNNTVYTFSVYLKRGTSPTSLVDFYVTSPYTEVTALVTWGTTPSVTYGFGGAATATTLLASQFTNVGNDWYRVALTMSTGTGTAFVCRVYVRGQGTTNIAGETVSVWGAQLEGGTSASNYYPVNSVSPSTTWFDTSGNNFHGTLINGPTYASTSGGYLNFDHTRFQYVDFSKNPSIEFLNTSSYTIESWIRITVNPGTGNYTGIFDREDTSVGGVRDGWNILVVEQPLGSLAIVHERFAQGPGATVGYGTGGTVAASVGVWLHITATYDGSTMRLYKNGLLDSSASPITGNMTNNIKNLTIGVRGGQYFRGQIAVARIYSRALSANEVTQNFNALRGRYRV